MIKDKKGMSYNSGLGFCNINNSHSSSGKVVDMDNKGPPEVKREWVEFLLGSYLLLSSLIFDATEIII